MSRKNDTIFQNWCDLLSKYIKENSCFPVLSEEYDGAKLGQWLNTQIHFFKLGTLPEDRIRMLDAIHPAWKGSREVRKAARFDFLLASNWQSKVPEGHIPITSYFQEPTDIVACLEAGIYDLEGFIAYCEDIIPSVCSKKENKLTNPFTRKNRDGAFRMLFPTLTYNHVVFQKDILDIQTPTLEYAHHLSNETFLRYSDQTITLAQALETVAPKDRYVLSLRYGLVYGQPLSNNDLAKALGVSPHLAKKQEEISLEKIRHPSRTKYLRKPFLLEGRPKRDIPDFGPMGTIKEAFIPGIVTELDRNGFRYVFELKNLSLEDAEKMLKFPDRLTVQEVLEFANKYSEPAEAQENRTKYRAFWKAAGVENVDLFDGAELGMLKQAYAFGCTPEEMHDIGKPESGHIFMFYLADEFLKAHAADMTSPDFDPWEYELLYYPAYCSRLAENGFFLDDFCFSEHENVKVAAQQFLKDNNMTLADWICDSLVKNPRKLYEEPFSVYGSVSSSEIIRAVQKFRDDINIGEIPYNSVVINLECDEYIKRRRGDVSAEHSLDESGFKRSLDDIINSASSRAGQLQSVDKKREKEVSPEH